MGALHISIPAHTSNPTSCLLIVNIIALLLRPNASVTGAKRTVDAVLGMLSGADDGDQTADMLRLAAEYLDGQGFGGPLAGKLRAKAERIESVLSNGGVHGRRGSAVPCDAWFCNQFPSSQTTWTFPFRLIPHVRMKRVSLG